MGRMQSTDALTSIFHKAASRTGEALTSVFARAALTRPGQFFVRHAGVISCASFFAGDLLYGINHWAPAAAFFAADAALAASDYIHNDKLKSVTKYPIPVAGLASIIGAALMVRAGWHEAGPLPLMISCSLIMLQGCAMTAQEQINNLARKMSHSESGFLRRVFRPLAEYPVLATTAADLVGKALLAITAIQ